jgi:hypothetical protein
LRSFQWRSASAPARRPIVAGRDFDQRDSRPEGEAGWRSAIVNEAFVKRYLGGRNPLGLRICEGSGPDAKPNIEIIGVMADFSYRGLREESEQAYFPISQGGEAGGNFYVKVRGTPEQAFQSIRTIVHNADPALPIASFRMLDEQVNRSLNTERMLAALSGAFGTLALLLSLVGLLRRDVVCDDSAHARDRNTDGARRHGALFDLACTPGRHRDDRCRHGYRIALRCGAGTAGGVSVVRRKTN